METETTGTEPRRVTPRSAGLRRWWAALLVVCLLAVAAYVLHTTEHPSAEKVWASVRKNFPMVSRATVYNTLNLFVEKGLLRELHLGMQRARELPLRALHRDAVAVDRHRDAVRHRDRKLADT